MPQGLAVYHAVKPTRDNETYYAHGHLLDFPRGSDLVLPSGRFSLADPGCICGCPNIVVHCRLAMRVIHNQGLPCPGEGFCCSLHFPHGDATGPNALELIWKPSDDDMAIFGSTNPDDWPNEWAWRSDCADDHGSSSCPTDSNGNDDKMSGNLSDLPSVFESLQNECSQSDERPKCCQCDDTGATEWCDICRRRFHVECLLELPDNKGLGCEACIFLPNGVSRGASSVPSYAVDNNHGVTVEPPLLRVAELTPDDAPMLKVRRIEPSPSPSPGSAACAPTMTPGSSGAWPSPSSPAASASPPALPRGNATPTIEVPEGAPDFSFLILAGFTSDAMHHDDQNAPSVISAPEPSHRVLSTIVVPDGATDFSFLLPPPTSQLQQTLANPRMEIVDRHEYRDAALHRAGRLDGEEDSWSFMRCGAHGSLGRPIALCGENVNALCASAQPEPDGENYNDYNPHSISCDSDLRSDRAIDDNDCNSHPSGCGTHPAVMKCGCLREFGCQCCRCGGGCELCCSPMSPSVIAAAVAVLHDYR